jgi:acyl-CoA thioester hydrolase
MAPVYQYQLEVPESAIDGNGHVNNIEYLRWMQTAATRHADSTGCTLATTQAGASWVVRSHRIDYLRPALRGERLEVRTWVADMRKASSLRKYKIVRVEDQAVLAKAETDWVFVDAATGRPRSIPETVKSLFVCVSPEQEP